jgi:hypothetical protein
MEPCVIERSGDSDRANGKWEEALEKYQQGLDQICRGAPSIPPRSYHRCAQLYRKRVCLSALITAGINQENSPGLDWSKADKVKSKCLDQFGDKVYPPIRRRLLAGDEIYQDDLPAAIAEYTQALQARDFLMARRAAKVGQPKAIGTRASTRLSKRLYDQRNTPPGTVQKQNEHGSDQIKEEPGTLRVTPPVDDVILLQSDNDDDNEDQSEPNSPRPAKVSVSESSPVAAASHTKIVDSVDGCNRNIPSPPRVVLGASPPFKSVRKISIVAAAAKQKPPHEDKDYDSGPRPLKAIRDASPSKAETAPEYRLTPKYPLNRSPISPFQDNADKNKARLETWRKTPPVPDPPQEHFNRCDQDHVDSEQRYSSKLEGRIKAREKHIPKLKDLQVQDNDEGQENEEGQEDEGQEAEVKEEDSQDLSSPRSKIGHPRKSKLYNNYKTKPDEILLVCSETKEGKACNRTFTSSLTLVRMCKTTIQFSDEESGIVDLKWRHPYAAFRNLRSYRELKRHWQVEHPLSELPPIFTTTTLEKEAKKKNKQQKTQQWNNNTAPKCRLTSNPLEDDHDSGPRPLKAIRYASPSTAETPPKCRTEYPRKRSPLSPFQDNADKNSPPPETWRETPPVSNPPQEYVNTCGQNHVDRNTCHGEQKYSPQIQKRQAQVTQLESRMNELPARWKNLLVKDNGIQNHQNLEHRMSELEGQIQSRETHDPKLEDLQAQVIQLAHRIDEWIARWTPTTSVSRKNDDGSCIQEIMDDDMVELEYQALKALSNQYQQQPEALQKDKSEVPNASTAPAPQNPSPMPVVLPSTKPMSEEPLSQQETPSNWEMLNDEAANVDEIGKSDPPPLATQDDVLPSSKPLSEKALSHVQEQEPQEPPKTETKDVAETSNKITQTEPPLQVTQDDGPLSEPPVKKQRMLPPETAITDATTTTTTTTPPPQLRKKSFMFSSWLQFNTK